MTLRHVWPIAGAIALAQLARLAPTRKLPIPLE